MASRLRQPAQVTHDLILGVWPTAGQDPEAILDTVDFAGVWREMPKIV